MSLNRHDDRDVLEAVAKHGKNFAEILRKAAAHRTITIVCTRADRIPSVDQQIAKQPEEVTRQQVLLNELAAAVGLIAGRANDFAILVKGARSKVKGRPRDLPMMTFVSRLGKIALDHGVRPTVDSRSADGDSKYERFLRAIVVAMPEHLRPASPEALIEKSNDLWRPVLAKVSSSASRGKRHQKI